MKLEDVKVGMKVVPHSKSAGFRNFDNSIELNKALEYCNNAGIEGIERDKILHPELFPCKTQCEACINIVLDTQMKNKQIRENQQFKTEKK